MEVFVDEIHQLYQAVSLPISLLCSDLQHETRCMACHLRKVIKHTLTCAYCLLSLSFFLGIVDNAEALAAETTCEEQEDDSRAFEELEAAIARAGEDARGKIGKRGLPYWNAEEEASSATDIDHSLQSPRTGPSWLRNEPHDVIPEEEESISREASARNLSAYSVLKNENWDSSKLESSQISHEDGEWSHGKNEGELEYMSCHGVSYAEGSSSLFYFAGDESFVVESEGLATPERIPGQVEPRDHSETKQRSVSKNDLRHVSREESTSSHISEDWAARQDSFLLRNDENDRGARRSDYDETSVEEKLRQRLKQEKKKRRGLELKVKSLEATVAELLKVC